jgi:hypothetical protein
MFEVLNQVASYPPTLSRTHHGDDDAAQVQVPTPDYMTTGTHPSTGTERPPHSTHGRSHFRKFEESKLNHLFGERFHLGAEGGKAAVKSTDGVAFKRELKGNQCRGPACYRKTLSHTHTSGGTTSGSS